MAEKKKEQVPDDQPTPNDQQTAPAKAEPEKLDKTVPGGRYIVNGRLVDCNGEPIEE